MRPPVTLCCRALLAAIGLWLTVGPAAAQTGSGRTGTGTGSGSGTGGATTGSGTTGGSTTGTGPTGGGTTGTGGSNSGATGGTTGGTAGGATGGATGGGTGGTTTTTTTTATAAQQPVVLTPPTVLGKPLPPEAEYYLIVHTTWLMSYLEHTYGLTYPDVTTKFQTFMNLFDQAAQQVWGTAYQGGNLTYWLVKAYGPPK